MIESSLFIFQARESSLVPVGFHYLITLVLKVSLIWTCAAVVPQVAAIFGTAACQLSPGSVAIPPPTVASLFWPFYVHFSCVETSLLSLKPHKVHHRHQYWSLLATEACTKRCSCNSFCFRLTRMFLMWSEVIQQEAQEEAQEESTWRQGEIWV